MIFRIATEPSRIGTMMPIDRKSLSSVLPRKRYSVSAQAAIAPKSSMKNSVPTVT